MALDTILDVGDILMIKTGKHLYSHRTNMLVCRQWKDKLLINEIQIHAKREKHHNRMIYVDVCVPVWEMGKIR